MSKRRELYELSKDAEAKIKKLKGMRDSLAEDWHKIVSECEESINSAAKRGEFKYYLDAAEFSMKTTEKVAAALKTSMDDVLVIVSPRGIEVNWETPE